MKRIPAISRQASRAQALVFGLQRRFVTGLERLVRSMGGIQRFAPVEWFRDNGLHGGGVRYQIANGDTFSRGSVNISQVHYDDNPARQLGSATAISSIVHPCNPYAPSVHIHISWTEMKDGAGYWRIMADLNPAIEDTVATEYFFTALKQTAPDQFEEAKTVGERYFFIPALGRRRGVAHFYLESYNSGDAEDDFSLAQHVGETAIDTWLAIVERILKEAPRVTAAAEQQQLAYHTLYFFQVLTLDRGTTSGLLAHNQNDAGILGSLPARVDRDLLHLWIARLPAPQDDLLTALIAVLPEGSPSLIDEAVKMKLANIVRDHYTTHPEAIAMQASGDISPPTLRNHI
ncbi:MAG: coproporphyrinogen III oxidase [Mariprofundaceae bacterium]|nr:coproporphyrinogen III oxidase [Mariprofundaceae bacterium]